MSGCQSPERSVKTEMMSPRLICAVSLRVLKVASQYKDHGLHYSVANRRDFMGDLEEEYGLGTTEGSDMPFVTIRTRLGHKYTMREEFTYVQSHMSHAKLPFRRYQ